MSKVKLRRSKKNKKQGYSLVELILAMALFSLFAGAIIFLVLGSYSSNLKSERLTIAKSYLEESNEAVRSISLEAFNLLGEGTYGLNFTGDKWELTEDPDDPDGDDGPFESRAIVIEDVNRNDNGDIDEAGTNNDPYTRKVTTTITWDIGGNQTTSTSSEIYLTGWEGDDWTQTDWQDGPGQAEWSDEEMFDSGDLDYSSAPGQISLVEVSQDTTHNWDFNTPSEYDVSDTDKIEVADGVAKLKTTASAVATTNQSFTVTWPGSEPDDWDNPGNFGHWINDVGQGYDDDFYIDVILPSRNTGQRADYWRQTIVIPEDNPDNAGLTFKWKCTDYSGNPNTVKIYINIDTNPGNPNFNNAIYEYEITGVSPGWQTITVPEATMLTALANADTYYLKVALYAHYDGAGVDGPFEINMDNIDLQWSKDAYPTDKPYVENIDPWEPNALGMITGFTETATKDANTEIYYQLSNDDGSTWYYFNTDPGTMEWQSTSDPDEANAAADVDQYIKYLDVDDNSQIKFRAYLESDGTGQVELNDIEMEYNPETVTMEAGTITVTENWQTFDLTNTYDANGPVIAATYWEPSPSISPGSIRIKDVTSNNFQARIEFPEPNQATTVSATAYYLAVEDGYWIMDNNTNTYIEAHRYNTSTVGRKGSWNADSKTYDLDYNATPMVLHQVMSDNDTDWITSWVSDDGSQTNPPDTDGYQVGLNAAEVNTSFVHGAEDIGVIIIENENNPANDFRTRITPDSIRGHDNGCFNYGPYYTDPVIIASQQQMDGGDGGWVVKCGPDDNRIRLHVEEDQYQNSERAHTTENAAFIVFEQDYSLNGKASGQYVDSGSLLSSAFQIVDGRNFNLINWDADNCEDCTLRLDVRTADTYAHLNPVDTPWQEFPEPGLLTYDDHNGNTWAQYQVYMEGPGDGSETPTLREVKIYYYE